MCLSGLVPEGLGNWMYHGYYPRFLLDAEGVWRAVSNPHLFRGTDWPSFTWVDWVFPMFLFAMGAAFPLALGRKLEKGVSIRRIVLGVVGRGLTLIGFAIYVRQITPSFIEYPVSTATWWLGLLGFVILFPVFTRLPRSWGHRRVLAVRLVGVAMAVGLVVYLNHADGEAFAFSHNDIIILLLAHMAMAGSLIWLISRRCVWARLLPLAVVYLAHHKAMHGGLTWMNPVVNLPERLLDLRWLNSHLPWEISAGLLDLSVLYDFTWYKFLFVVVPGTIIGDLLNRYMQSERANHSNAPWSNSRLYGIASAMLCIILVVLVGLQCHGLVLIEIGTSLAIVTPWATWLGVLPVLLAVVWLVRGAQAPMDRLIRSLVLWGVLWLVLGLCAEPYEGGITKGPPVTLSYYFVSLGLSIMLLAALTIWIDALGRRKSLALLVLNGQNPMLAYAGIRNLLAPLVMLPLLAPITGALPWLGSNSFNGLAVGLLNGSPWTLFIWSVVQTLLLAVFISVFTRTRIIWRA